MPTYQYACTECGHQFETVQSFSDDALTECPQCTGRLRKVFNAVGIVFKGSGFYRNDSREKAPAGAGKGDKGSGEPKKADAPAAKEAKLGKDATKPSKGSGGAGSSGGSRSSTPSSTTGSAA